MKKMKYNQIAGLLLTIFILPGCFKDHITHTYTLAIPVYKSLSAVRADMKSAPSTPLNITGKIYMQGNYIFLNEQGKGIHIIDNSVPSSPRNISFIAIPGNEDIAVSGHTLYADSYSDLVVLDITDPVHASAKKFIDNVFPDRGGYYPGTNPDSILIVVDYIYKDTTVDAMAPSPIIFYSQNCPSCNFLSVAPAASNSQTDKGVGGSMARFAVVNNYLYTVGTQSLSVFDISYSLEPVFKTTTTLSWGVETIYPFENRLFIGSNSGVFMFDIEADPSSPKQIGQFAHARACDPVVANDHYAFVTLSDGTKCQGYENQMDIIDISELSTGYSAKVKTYPLTHPKGLSITGNTLFVCDDKDGVKIYDATDVMDLKLIGNLHDTAPFDVILTNGVAIVIGNDGLYQYDYNDPKNIHLLSKLSTGKN